MKPTVLVTGANGFTGSYFCQYLAQRGISTRGMYYPPDGVPEFSHENLELIPGDLCDRESLKPALEGIEIVQNVGALFRPINVPDEMYYKVNVEGVRNIIEIAATADVKRFVQCSTAGVHGHIENPPADENAPLKPHEALFYGTTKLEGEQLALDLCPKLGMEVVAVRPAGIYGPRESRFLKLAKTIKNRTFTMFGNGETLYHFVHVEDLCDAFMLCADRPEAVGQTYIIADDHPITLNNVVRIVTEELGLSPTKRHLPLWILLVVSGIVEFGCKPFGIRPPLYRRRAFWFWATRAFDISQARRELGYEPKVAPEDGLKAMVRSFSEAGWLA